MYKSIYPSFPDYSPSVPVGGDVIYGCVREGQLLLSGTDGLLNLEAPEIVIRCLQTGRFQEPDEWPQCVTSKREIFCACVTSWRVINRVDV